MAPNLNDLLSVLPELVWCGFALLLVLLQSVTRHHHVLNFVALLGAALGTIATFGPMAHPGSAFHGTIASDPFSLFFHWLVGLVAFLVILASDTYLDREGIPAAEFYALILFATAGMGVLASAQELLTAFVGLELSSISSYILAGYRRDSIKSSESALKYFLLGSFATSFFLYGIALVYGATGTTNIAELAATSAAPGYLLRLGLTLILVGLGFKVAAAPFQVWTPDVYEGAPTPITALFSAGPKAAAFALILRIFAGVPAATSFWFWAFWVLAALSMFAGNLGALLQHNLKRLLAYSSISHAGYILVAFASLTFLKEDPTQNGPAPAYAAILFYLLAYSLVSVGAFTIVSELGGRGERFTTLEDFAGLSTRQPFAAASLAIFFLSLLGLPLTAGFMGKFYIFKAALDSHLIWLAILLGINSVIGAYYYLRVIVYMYMHEHKGPLPADAPTGMSFSTQLVVAVTLAGTIALGIAPNAVVNMLLNPNLLALAK